MAALAGNLNGGLLSRAR